MTKQDLFNQSIINEINTCFLCGQHIYGIKHITVNFKKDAGKFSLEYIAVCERCAKRKPYAVALLGKGAKVPFPKVSIN